MEIHKMLCLSTAHLTFSTRTLLEQDELPGSIFFPKDIHGWFMHVPEQQLLQDTLGPVNTSAVHQRRARS